ncbi:MAG: chromosome segregation protein SMC [Parachlamydiaceae bacterium]
MKLKKVEISGFKSFADKVTLTFHNGITCIVGPNGCGKSNIADAMRWVFGEQSAKSMRGDKMVDVIFAGTATRRSVNLAEVTITFTEINGALPIEYDEIAVTRRLHRSGESDYFINRQPVRLKDLQSLFLDTGIGRTAFSIFEQGKIDQIIQQSPVGRRILFEEAAGITRYLQRKKETLRRFEAIDQNHSRAKDIYLEVEKQLVKLEEQAKEAKIFQADKVLLEKLEKSYLFAQHEHYLQKSSELEAQKTEFQEQLKKLQEKYQFSCSEHQALKETIHRLEKGKASITEKINALLSEQKVKNEKERLNKEQLQELQQKQIEYQKELKELEKKQDGWLVEIKQCEKKQQGYERSIKQAAEEFNQQEQGLKTVEGELNQLREKQVKSHQDKLKHIQQENQVTQDLKTLRVRTESYQEKQLQVEEKQQKNQLMLEELKKTEEDQKKHFQTVLKRNDSLKADLAKMDTDLKKLLDDIRIAQLKKEQLSRDLQESVVRRHALIRLKEDHEGFSAGSKKILKEAASPGSPLFGIVKGLYEYISADKGHEADLAIILKRYAETLVVEKLTDLNVLLNYAEQQSINDIAVICLETLQEQAGLTKIKDSFFEKTNETKLARHFFRQVVLAKSFENALTHCADGLESLTPEKYFIDRFRVVYVRPSQENSIFVREAEIKALAKSIKEQEKTVQEAEAELHLLNEKKSQVQSDRQQLDKEIRANEIRLVEANFALQKIQNEHAKARKDVEHLKQEMFNTESALTQLLKQQNELEQKLIAIREKTDLLLNADSTLETSLAAKLEERKHLFDLVEQKRKNLSLCNDENRKNQHALSLLAVKKQESENSFKRISSELVKQELRIKEILASEQQGKLDDVQLINALKVSKGEEEKLLNEIKKAKTQLFAIETTNESLQKEIKANEKNVHHLEVQLAQVKTSRENIQKTLQERFEDSQSAEALEMTFDQAEKKMKQVRGRIDQAKNINLSAIEEFEKSKERHRFLDEQLQDLSMAKKELEEAILALDSETRGIFAKTFSSIRDNFKKNFSLLFNGGEADLELIDSKDVLEAGVEIVARPPGKQMRSLSLLSGGEKCLTAMALLFSIFEVKAAPFCILDEIDAPLDDSNIERFIKVVKQFVDRCQFIIISHNKQTMAIADRLFGVSMQEKGVSKLLAIEFEKETKSPELVEVL